MGRKSAAELLRMNLNIQQNTNLTGFSTRIHQRSLSPWISPRGMYARLLTCRAIISELDEIDDDVSIDEMQAGLKLSS